MKTFVALALMGLLTASAYGDSSPEAEPSSSPEPIHPFSFDPFYYNRNAPYYFDRFFEPVVARENEGNVQIEESETSDQDKILNAFDEVRKTNSHSLQNRRQSQRDQSRFENQRDQSRFQDQRDQSRFQGQRDQTWVQEQKRIQEQRDQKRIQDLRDQKRIQDLREQKRIQNLRDQKRIQDQLDQKRIQDLRDQKRIQDQLDQTRFLTQRDQTRPPIVLPPPRTFTPVLQAPVIKEYEDRFNQNSDYWKKKIGAEGIGVAAHPDGSTSYIGSRTHGIGKRSADDEDREDLKESESTPRSFWKYPPYGYQPPYHHPYHSPYHHYDPYHLTKYHRPAHLSEAQRLKYQKQWPYTHHPFHHYNHHPYEQPFWNHPNHPSFVPKWKPESKGIEDKSIVTKEVAVHPRGGVSYIGRRIHGLGKRSFDFDTNRS